MSEPRTLDPSPPDARALEALNRYLDELALVRQRSERTIRNYRDDLRGFLVHLAGAGVEFDEAGREQARSYLGLLLLGENRAARLGEAHRLDDPRVLRLAGSRGRTAAGASRRLDPAAALTEGAEPAAADPLRQGGQRPDGRPRGRHAGRTA